MGTWNFAPNYYNPISQNQRQKILRTAITSSILEFDSAYSYGNGKSEQSLAASINQLVRENFLSPQEANKLKISSKAILKNNLSVTTDIKKSLYRLNRNSLYTFFVHWPKADKNYKSHFEALVQAKTEGLISKIGVSNFSLIDLMDIEKICKIDTVQIGLNLLWLAPLDDIVPYCQEKKIEIQIYSPLAQGLLSSRLYTHNSILNSTCRLFDDKRTNHLIFLQEPLFSKLHPILLQINKAALPLSLQEAALLFLHKLIPDARIVVGAKSANQLKELVAVFLNSGDVKKELAQTQFEELLFLAKKANQTVREVFPEATNIFNHKIL